MDNINACHEELSREDMSEVKENQPMLNKVTELFDELNEASIPYCHWKSNDKLNSAILGEGDLDFLIAREYARQFEAAISNLGFRFMIPSTWKLHPSIHHYYAYDDSTGQIVHLHVYYRIVTAGSLVKGYRIPLESMYFNNLHRIGKVPVPSKSCELVILILRKMLEFGTVTEIPFMQQEYNHLQKEISLLDESEIVDEAANLWRDWLPFADVELFYSALTSLRLKRSHFYLFMLGQRFHRVFKSFRIVSTPRRFFQGTWRFLCFLLYRYLGPPGRGFKATSGGAMIAFVGGDGSGKSTLLAETSNWLEDYFRVKVVHAGKPPFSLVSFIPSLCLPLIRLVLPKMRTNVVEYDKIALGNTAAAARQHSLIYILRSVMIASDQWKLLTKYHRKSIKGQIVLCDRYPAMNLGGMDGPRLDPSNLEEKSSVHRWLASLEKRLYSTIPKPDLVLFITTPPDVAVHRNSIRNKKGPKETEVSIRFRHERMANSQIDGSSVVTIDSNRSLSETLLEVKRNVWNVI